MRSFPCNVGVTSTGRYGCSDGDYALCSEVVPSFYAVFSEQNKNNTSDIVYQLRCASSACPSNSGSSIAGCN